MKMENISNFVKFLVVGMTSTSIDFIFYMILTNIIDISLAKFISFGLASVFSFFINKKWTFNNQNNIELRLVVKYSFSQLINIIINVSTNAFLYSMLNNKIISFIFATGTAMIVNYTLQKLIVFRVRKGDEGLK